MSLSKSLYILCIFGVLLGAKAQDYKIKMSSPSKIGDRYLQMGNGSSSEIMTIFSKDKVLKAKKFEFKATIEGIVTILKIDNLKRASKLKFVVKKCLASYGDNPNKIEILQKDSTIIITTQEKKTLFLFHDKQLPPRIAKVLDLFIDLPHSQSTDDDIFAPAERKKVGDKWKINSVQAATDLTTTGLKVKPKNITGDVTLEKVVTVGKTECLLIKADMKIKDISLPMAPGLDTKKSIMSAIFSGDFPVDPEAKTYDILTSNKTFSMEFEAEGESSPDHPLIKISMKINKSVIKKTQNLK